MKKGLSAKDVGVWAVLAGMAASCLTLIYETAVACAADDSALRIVGYCVMCAVAIFVVCSVGILAAHIIRVL